jgi:hypothetical protein
VVYKAELTELIQRHQGGSPIQTMYYIGRVAPSLSAISAERAGLRFTNRLAVSS